MLLGRVVRMTDPHASPLSRWRYGIHPHATEMRIRSLGAFTFSSAKRSASEMVNAAPDGDEPVHLQYYIATELGPWALWLSFHARRSPTARRHCAETPPPRGGAADLAVERVTLLHAEPPLRGGTDEARRQIHRRPVIPTEDGRIGGRSRRWPGECGGPIGPRSSIAPRSGDSVRARLAAPAGVGPRP